jgi:hypothetical protein
VFVPRRVSYSAEIFSKIAIALDGCEEFYQYQIEQGIAVLWEINQGESYAITRDEFDHKNNGHVLVLCVYEGQKVVEFLENLTASARHSGRYIGIRAHSKRRGFERIAASLGWQSTEFKERVFYNGWQ